MIDFELTVPQSAEDCLKTIKQNIPSCYTMTEKFVAPKYSYKIKKNYTSIIGWGIGYPPIDLKVQLLENNGNETNIIAKFKKSILIRLFIWICSMAMFFVSVLFIIGILLGDVPINEDPLLNCGLPSIELIISILYPLYTEIMRKREKERIINLLNDIFSK